jgi:hypothetical protein
VEFSEDVEIRPTLSADLTITELRARMIAGNTTLNVRDEAPARTGFRPATTVQYRRMLRGCTVFVPLVLAARSGSCAKGKALR